MFSLQRSELTKGLIPEQSLETLEFSGVKNIYQLSFVAKNRSLSFFEMASMPFLCNGLLIYLIHLRVFQ